jgi:sugar phosphate isomerase/epimerase
MKLGIGSYTFPWAIGVPGYSKPREPLSLMGLLARARKMGVKVVQICDNLPLNSLSDVGLKNLRDRAEETKVEIELGTRGVDPKNLLRYLEIARYLNAKVVRTIITENDLNLGMNKVLDNLKSVAPKFAKARIHVAIENYESIKSRDLVKIINKLRHHNVGVCLDTANSIGSLESTEEVTKLLAPHVVSLHVKDFKIIRFKHKMGFKVIGCPVGKGRLDIDWLLGVLEKEDREPNAILELWTPFSGTVEKTILKEYRWAEESIRFLRGKMKDG